MYWKIININVISDSAYNRAFNVMSPSRRAHVERMKLADDRRRSIAGEIIACELLNERFGISQQILRDDNGRPFISGDAVYISIAHSGDYAVCAADRLPIGIDIESISAVTPRLVDRICTAEEAAYISEGGNLNTERLCEIWTAKEAYFKKLGTGITDFKSVNTLTLDRYIEHVNGYIIQII